MTRLQPLTFEKMKNRHRLRAEIVTVTGLRVGAGKSQDAAATDQPVMRNADGQPFLPGSSIKGAMRSAIEAVLRSLDRDDLRACDLFAEPCIEHERDRDIPLEEVLEKICTTCSLFGSPFLAGRLFVHDAPWLGEGMAKTELRDGVGIDRDSGTARRGIKFDTEVVPPGHRFRLSLVLENADEIRLALVLQTLEMLRNGEIPLGGMTTRGLGTVRLESVELERTTPARLLAGEEPYEPLVYAAELDKGRQALHRLLEGN